MLTKMRLFYLYMGAVEGRIRNETTTALLGLRMRLFLSTSLIVCMRCVGI